MTETRSGAPLSGARKWAVAAMPWVFLALLGAVYDVLVIPRVSSPSLLLIVVGLFLAMVVISFTAAAVTFSRDVLTGRYRA
jgi:hypothetical protein